MAVLAFGKNDKTWMGFVSGIKETFFFLAATILWPFRCSCLKILWSGAHILHGPEAHRVRMKQGLLPHNPYQSVRMGRKRRRELNEALAEREKESAIAYKPIAVLYADVYSLVSLLHTPTQQHGSLAFKRHHKPMICSFKLDDCCQQNNILLVMVTGTFTP